MAALLILFLPGSHFLLGEHFSDWKNCPGSFIFPLNSACIWRNSSLVSLSFILHTQLQETNCTFKPMPKTHS